MEISDESSYAESDFSETSSGSMEMQWSDAESENGNRHKESLQRQKGPRTLHEILEKVQLTTSSDKSGDSNAINKKTKTQPDIIDGTLQPHQVEGLSWLTSIYDRGLSGILADEMGLGKTLQSISLIAHLIESNKARGPFLVVAPLSAVQSVWVSEFAKFAPSIRTTAYVGEKHGREDIRREIIEYLVSKNTKEEQKSDPRLSFQVLITNYEIVISDAAFLNRFLWRLCIVDEAHRLKNSKSLLHQTLINEYSIPRYVLLTGTPLQNNLRELWGLLSFCARDIFIDGDLFVRLFGAKNVPLIQAQNTVDPESVNMLHAIMRPYILRRVKSQITHQLPDITEFVVYTGLSAMQKAYYKAILKRDTDAFIDSNTSVPNGITDKRLRGLQNIMMQLRKCCCHPYLFEGSEPEPFLEGDHLFENSGKLALLDSLLPSLRDDGHRVLLFSQMTHVLDIIQDYLQYRGFSYERLDGNVRGEERTMAVQRFSKGQGPFVFLLSTRAGGLGLNLVAADTVVLYDSDFNPQMDLQAIARAHRYGQTKTVRVYRLVCENTVEEIMLKRSMKKLALERAVVGTGGLHTATTLDSHLPTMQEMVRFGLRYICDSDESTIPIGETSAQILERAKALTMLNTVAKGGPVTEGDSSTWFGMAPDAKNEAKKVSPPIVSDIEPSKKSEVQDVVMTASEPQDKGVVVERIHVTDDKDVSTSTSLEQPMYVFEGEDFGNSRANADRDSLVELIKEAKELKQIPDVEMDGTKTLRKRKLDAIDEAAVARAVAERKRKRLERQDLARKQKWENAGYTSAQILFHDNKPDEAAPVISRLFDADRPAVAPLRFVAGDCSHPQSHHSHPFSSRRSCKLIVNAVDASGSWGKGGFFAALDRTFKSVPRDAYELAGEMDDLEMGSVHLVPVTPPSSKPEHRADIYVCHIVCLKMAKRGTRHSRTRIEIDVESLTLCLKKLEQCAQDVRASIHTPRLGQRGTAEWYSAERIFRRYVAGHGIPIFVYYYKPSSKSHSKHSHRPTHSQPTSNHAKSSSGEPSRSVAIDDPKGKRPIDDELTASSYTTTSSGTSLRSTRVSFHHIQDKKKLDTLMSSVRSLHGTLVADPLRATHLVCGVKGWDKMMLKTVSQNPDLLCVHDTWIDASLKSPHRPVDAILHTVPTGKVFLGVEAVVKCAQAEIEARIIQDIISYGGIAFHESIAPDRKCTHIISDLESPKLKTVSGIPVVTPEWVDSCIEADTLLDVCDSSP